MMRSLGHEVFEYVAADPLSPLENQLQPFEVNHPRWIAHNARCIQQIAKNLQPRDFLCLIAGVCQQPIVQAFPKHLSVEYGVGYYGTFAAYCVYESYAHMANVYGRKGIVEGRFFDTVIPNYYDPADFPLVTEKDDYLLFIGRLNRDKGVQIAIDVAHATGRRLVVAGQGQPPTGCDYHGVVGVQERAELMGHARAVFAPTLYLEPFGGVAVEAQLCGTPVLTTDFGAFPETVEQGLSGFRCHTLGEFIDGVNSAGALDPRAIRQRAVGKYSLDIVSRQYQAYFERLALLWGDGWYDMGQPSA